MAKAPLRTQLLALVGILLFTAAFGACSVGIRAGGAQLYAMPACEQACHASQANAADVEVRMGKRDHSACVCTNGVRLPSSEADAVGALSFFVPTLTVVLAGILVFLGLSRRARART